MKIVFILLASCLLVGCGDVDQDSDKVVRDGKYGGTLVFSELESLISLYPFELTDAVSYRIADQIYDGLVKFNAQSLEIEPAIAEEWEKSEDGKTYTFRLRKGVRFHDNPCFPNGKGREVTAEDFVYSFTKLCKPNVPSAVYVGFMEGIVAGARAYYNEEVDHVSGLKAIDRYTLQIELEQPHFYFLQKLAGVQMSLTAREAVEAYGVKAKVGTGPFVYKQLKQHGDNQTVLVRNSAYYGRDKEGQRLPYLDTIKVMYMSSLEEQLISYNKGELDFVLGLPQQSISDVVERRISEFQSDNPSIMVDRKAQLKTHYYEFNTATSVFKDKRIRQALSYAIDRKKVFEQVLFSAGHSHGTGGIIPPILEGYQKYQVPGYDFDPEKGRKLLAEAGYPNGVGFPQVVLQVNPGGTKHTAVATEIRRQLRHNLNVSIEMEVVPFRKKLANAAYGKADIFRSGWVADYPNPENFLWLFYSKTIPGSMDKPSYPNTMRYRNSKFDEYFEKGKHALTKEESYQYFSKAEQIVMEDAPIIVLWYDELYWLLNPKVKGLKNNEMQFWDFSEVYLE